MSDTNETSALMVYINGLRAELATVKAERDAMRAAIAAILECPYFIDEASVPKAGIDAHPEQVVGNMSVSIIKVRALRAALDARHD